MKKRTIYFIFLAFLFVACKRNAYEVPVYTEPVFSLKGTLNGEVFELNAGIDGIYHSSELLQNGFGVYEFNSAFYNVNCDTCESVLSIKVMDDEQTDPGQLPDQSALSNGILPFAVFSNSSDFLTIHFHINNQPGNNYEWHFGDGGFGFGHSAAHSYTTPGIYQVSVDISNGGGPGDDITISRTIHVGSPVILSAPFVVVNQPGNNWHFAVPPMLPPGLTALYWTINGSPFTGNLIEAQIDSPTEVCLHFYNAQLESEGSYCIVFDGGINSFTNTNLNYNWQAQELNLGKVIVEYRSEDGSLYHSVTEANGTGPSHFEILSSENYPNGINGKAAMRVSLIFSAYLRNVNSPADIIYFENATASVGYIVE